MPLDSLTEVIGVILTQEDREDANVCEDPFQRWHISRCWAPDAIALIAEILAYVSVHQFIMASIQVHGSPANRDFHPTSGVLDHSNLHPK